MRARTCKNLIKNGPKLVAANMVLFCSYGVLSTGYILDARALCQCQENNNTQYVPVCTILITVMSNIYYVQCFAA